MKRLFPILVCVAGFTVALAPGELLGAGERNEIAACSRIEGPWERLACFDEIARKLGVRAAERPSSGWRVRSRDEKTVEATLDAGGMLNGNGVSARPKLVLRCKNGSMDAWIRTGLLPEPEPGRTSVILQFDSKPYYSVKTTPMEDGRVLRFRETDQLVERLIAHERMMFQFQPLDATPASTYFLTEGLDDVLEPLMGSCGIDRLN